MTEKDIKILRLAYLRGPNIWTYRPTLEAWIDIGDLEDCPSNTLPGFATAQPHQTTLDLPKMKIIDEMLNLDLLSTQQHREIAVLNSSSLNSLRINTYRKLYQEKRDAALEALEQYLPRVKTTRPSGGFFLWLTLPEGLNSKEMLPLAVNELVAYTPGTAFYGDGRGANNIRVCFSHPTAENVKVGIKRLSNVINLQLDLLDTFGNKA